MKWISRLQYLLSKFSERESVSERQRSGDCVQLFIDRLEERRVLSVSASLIAGELIVESSPGAADSVTIELTNAGDPGNETILIFDNNVSTTLAIDVLDENGNSLGNDINSSLIPSGLTVNLGDENDELTLQIPSGSSGPGSPLSINVDGGLGDDVITLVDNGETPGTAAPIDVDLQVDAELIQFGDADFQLGTVDLDLNGSLRLTTDQGLTTEGATDIEGDVFSDAPLGTGFDFAIDTNSHSFSIDGSLGLSGEELDSIQIDASTIRLGGDTFSLGMQDYDGNLLLNDDVTINSLSAGDVSLGSIDGNGFSLSLMTEGDVSFSGDAADLENLVVATLGTTTIDTASIAASISIQFDSQVVVAADTVLTGTGSVQITGAINSAADEFNTLTILSPGNVLPVDGLGTISLEENAGAAVGGALGAVTLNAADKISLHDVTTRGGNLSLTAGVVSTKSSYVTNGGDFTVVGNWDVQSSSIVTTAGGEIDLGAAVLFTTNPNADPEVNLNLDASGVIDGDIFLGESRIPAMIVGAQLLDNVTIVGGEDVVFSSGTFSLAGGFFQVDGSGETTVDGTINVVDFEATTTDLMVLQTASVTAAAGIDLDLTGVAEINSDLTTTGAAPGFDIKIAAANIQLGADLSASGSVSIVGPVTLTGDQTIASEHGETTVTGDVLGDGVLQHQVTFDGETTVSGSVGGVGATLGNLISQTGSLLAGAINISGNLNADQSLNTNISDIAVGGHLTAKSTVESAGGINIGGTSQLGGDVTSVTDQEYMDAVTLTSDVHFSAADGIDLDSNAITFFQSLDEDAGATSSNAVLTTSDDILFAGSVGASTAIDSLLVKGANNVTFDSTVRVAGGLAVDSTQNLSFNSTVETGGDFIQSDGTGTTQFNGTSGTGIGGDLLVSTENVIFAGDVVTTVGDVAVIATGSISFTETVPGTGGLDAGSSMITLLADIDSDNVGAFSQATDSVIATTNETVDAVTIAVLGAGNAGLATIQAGTTSGVVSVSVGGEILDATLSSEGANITAFAAGLRAQMGIGGAGGVGDLNTNVDQIAFVNTAGALHIQNNGALTLQSTAGILESQALGGGSITTSSPLTIAMNTVVGGNFTFTAGDSAAIADNLTIKADVTHMNGNGTINFVAGDDIIQQSGTITNTGGATNEVHFVADNEGVLDADRGSIIQIAGARLVAGNVSFSASENVLFDQPGAPGNDVDVVAATLTGMGSRFAFSDLDELLIGTAGTVVGVTTNSGDVSFDAAGLLTIGDGVNGQDIQAGTGIVLLNSAGVTEASGSTVTADGIELLGAGFFDLSETNQINNFAASIDGELTLVDAGTLLVGTVDGNDGFAGGTDGISTNGNHVSLTIGGLLTLGDGGSQGINAGAANVVLDSAGAAETAGSTIFATNLELLGTGNFLLNEANDVDVLAAAIMGELSFVDSDNLEVGTVNATSGISTFGSNVTIQSGSDLLVNQNLTTDGGDVDLFADGQVVLTLGDDISTTGVGSSAGSVVIQSNTGNVELRGDVVAVGAAGENAGDVTIESIGANVILANADVSAGNDAGNIDVTANLDVTLTGNLNALGVGSDGFVSLTAGGDIIDGNDGSTLISTGDLSLTASTNIGEIDDFVARTGNAIDAAVTGLLQDLSTTDAGGEIHLQVMGDLQAATGAIVPDGDGAATLLLQTAGQLDVGTNPGVLNLSDGDFVGLHAGTVLTLPDAGMNVGAGTLRLSGGTDVVDPAGRDLGKLTAQNLFLTSNSNGGDTTLNLDVTNLDVDFSGSPAGTKLTINNDGALNVDQIVTNNGDVRINNSLLLRGDLGIGQIDAGTGDVFLDTTPFGGQIRDLDEGAMPINTNVDIIAAGLAVRTANNSVMNIVDHTLEVQVDTLAAAADNLGVKIFDETGNLEIGTVDGLNGITVTGADGNDVVEVVTVGGLSVTQDVINTGLADLFLAAGGNGDGNDLNIDASIQNKGTAGELLLIAGDDVTFTGTSQVTTENDLNIRVLAGVDVLTPDVSNMAPFSTGNANGDILMGDGSLIGTNDGTATLRATRDVAVSVVNANLDNDATLGNVVTTADQNGLADFVPNGDGEIRETLTGEAAIIIADDLSLSAATGIGAVDDLELDVNTVDATNGTTGDIQLSEVAGTGDNDLTVNLLSNQNGNVNVQTDDGNLTIARPVSTTNAGNVVLVAGDDDTDGNGDLSIQSSVMTEGGSVQLTSEGNDVSFTSDGDVTTISGRVDVNAGATDDSGNIAQAIGSVIDAGNAQVEFNANGQITLNQIVTDNTSTAAVTLNADMGVDSVDPLNVLNIDAAAGRLVVNMESGVGPIRTTVESLDLANLSTGGITITETDAINIIRVDQNAAAGIDLTAGGTMTIVGGEAGVTGTSAAVNLTSEGAGSEIVVNSTVQSTTGKITINAADNVRMGAAGIVATQAAELLIVGGDALNNASVTTGGVLMEDGATIEAADARVDLVAKQNVQVGRISTTTEVRLTSTEAAVSDAGDSGGVDVTANSLGISAVTGIGSGDALETSVALLAVSNTMTGGIEIDNTSGMLLTIGDFNSTPLDAALGPISGISLAGNAPENIIVNHDEELLVASPVLNSTGGEIDFSSGTDLTVQAQIIAEIYNPLGIVRLDAGADLIVLDTDPTQLLASDIEGFQVIGTAGSPVPIFDQGTGLTVYDPLNPDLFNPQVKPTDPLNFDPNSPTDLALLPVRFAENVIVRSNTGAVTQPVPSLTNIDTPQILTTGIATITGDFGRNSENEFTYVVDWDSVFGDETDVFNSGDPLFSHEDGMVVGVVPGLGPGVFDFDFFYSQNPNPNSPAAPILITITVLDDAGISFFADGGSVDLGAITMSSEAPVPGEGLGGAIAFDLSIEVPQLEAPRVQFSETFEGTLNEVTNADEEGFTEGVIESDAGRDELILIIQKIGPKGKIQVDQFGRPFQRTLHGPDAIQLLNDLPDLHKRLDVGHWKIFTKEGEDGQLMLVEDVMLRDGRPVVGDEGTQDRPPTSENDGDVSIKPGEAVEMNDGQKAEPRPEIDPKPKSDEERDLSLLKTNSTESLAMLGVGPLSLKTLRSTVGKVNRLKHFAGVLLGFLR